MRSIQAFTKYQLSTIEMIWSHFYRARSIQKNVSFLSQKQLFCSDYFYSRFFSPLRTILKEASCKPNSSFLESLQQQICWISCSYHFCQLLRNDFCCRWNYGYFETSNFGPGNALKTFKSEWQKIWHCDKFW